MTYSKNDSVFTFVCPSSICREAGRAIPHHVLYATDCNHCSMRLNQLPEYPHQAVKAFTASNRTTADANSSAVSQEYILTPSATFVPAGPTSLSPAVDDTLSSPAVDDTASRQKQLENSMRQQARQASHSRREKPVPSSDPYTRPNSNGKFPSKSGRKSDDMSEVSASSNIVATLTKDFKTAHYCRAEDVLAILSFLRNHPKRRRTPLSRRSNRHDRADPHQHGSSSD
jgi:hypothetical protein